MSKPTTRMHAQQRNVTPIRVTQDSASVQGHLLKMGRLRLGLRQADVARLIGRSKQWVQDIERGKKHVTSYATAKQLADEFGQHSDDWFLAIGRCPTDVMAYLGQRPKVVRQIRKLMDAEELKGTWEYDHEPFERHHDLKS